MLSKIGSGISVSSLCSSSTITGTGDSIMKMASCPSLASSNAPFSIFSVLYSIGLFSRTAIENFNLILPIFPSGKLALSNRPQNICPLEFFKTAELELLNSEISVPGANCGFPSTFLT